MPFTSLSDASKVSLRCAFLLVLGMRAGVDRLVNFKVCPGTSLKIKEVSNGGDTNLYQAHVMLAVVFTRKS